ncbi:hypothetical protein C8A05DRAFT_47614 [Staphylotrichum tortipilum]|uniref:Azaphilone pigments biosynthesis cluster protein L N-terminal domain-containing protein n=1 Tax=Staphylotrichum tortipilum TaxID=2831512 RepID=A0AAN6MD83_9PEZI|nr:hypothetical protein C8A05DRAFT_47614 [Staphylotrichum longicolle]
MSVGFGFSVGDFISWSGGDSRQRYHELISELYSLEAALLHVKRLGESQNAEKIALCSASSQCQRAITDFWEKAQKYHPSLRKSASSTVKDHWRKLKWALLKEDDVEKFKADLRGHTGSINLLLSACQARTAAIQDTERQAKQKSLMALIQTSIDQWMSSLSHLLTSTSLALGHISTRLTTLSQTNVRIFQIVLDLQAWIKHIPGQVQHQQPVLFLDALGKQQRFHLDFIQLADVQLQPSIVRRITK